MRVAAIAAATADNDAKNKNFVEYNEAIFSKSNKILLL